MKLFLLPVLVIAMCLDLPAASQLFCEAQLPMWWNLGCVLDYADACVVDEQNKNVGPVQFNPTAGCGWGGSSGSTPVGQVLHYDCGTSGQMSCKTACYVPCPGETVPRCSSIDIDPMTTTCGKPYFSRCSKTCGVGVRYHGYICAGVDVGIVCMEECCCKRCTGGPGVVTSGNLCDAENMMNSLAAPEKLCVAI